MRDILAEPSVGRWWAPRGPERAATDLYEDDDNVPLAIELDGQVIGFIQFSEENTPDYRHAGIDLFVDTAHQGQGLGADAIRAVARYLIDVRGHHRLTIDPSVDNERAIRAYRRVGFRPVGVMRGYERRADGEWHDALLLDMLASELTEGERPG
jgi:aminoglycoside 6'-N-acetyltransferase